MAEAGADRPPDGTAVTVNGDGTRLPFGDDTFDRIICSEVLEHIPDVAAAAAELFRVLKPGGILAATVPTWFPEQVCWAINDEYHAPFVEGGHIRIFTEPRLRALLRGAGFKPGPSHHAHALHSPYWWLKCAVGPTNNDNPLVKAYHSLLVWDIAKAPKLTRWTEKVLNPVLGKSLVVYSRKPVPAHAPSPGSNSMTAPSVEGIVTSAQVQETVDAIAEWQLPSGMVPWFPGGHADPWNHVEAAMALALGDRIGEAERAYDWLVGLQRPDGAWHQYYLDGSVEQDKLDANVCAYIAGGVWHHWLLTKDTGFAETMWPVVEKAMEFVLGLQTERGEILWARHADGTPWSFALLTGSSSTCHSLRCAIALANHLGHERPRWENAAARLAHTIRTEPDAFAPKHRWAMDWYYPVLTGRMVDGERCRTGAKLGPPSSDAFLMDGRGIRCVSDRPWVTVAETCECSLSYLAVGDRDTALKLFGWAQQFREPGGRYWTGTVYPEEVHFPGGEQSTYTAGKWTSSRYTVPRQWQPPGSRYCWAQPNSSRARWPLLDGNRVPEVHFPGSWLITCTCGLGGCSPPTGWPAPAPRQPCSRITTRCSPSPGSSILIRRRLGRSPSTRPHRRPAGGRATPGYHRRKWGKRPWLAIVWDFDSAQGQVGATYPYHYRRLPLEQELEGVAILRAQGARLGVPMTFATVGFAAEDVPAPFEAHDLIRGLHDDGHEIASHSWRHEWLPHLTTQQLRRSLVRSKVALERVTGEVGGVRGLVPPFNRPMTWLRHGIIRPGDRWAFPPGRGATNDGLLREASGAGYDWVRISLRPLVGRRPDPLRAPFREGGCTVVPHHYDGFDGKAGRLLDQAVDRRCLFVLTGHPSGLFRPGNEHLELVVGVLEDAARRRDERHPADRHRHRLDRGPRVSGLEIVEYDDRWEAAHTDFARRNWLFTEAPSPVTPPSTGGSSGARRRDRCGG